MTFGELRQRIATFRDQAFVPREIFFRSGDRFHHLRVSTRVQKLAAGMIGLFVAWSVYATGSYVVTRMVLADKNAQIERHRLAYFDLLSEVGEYHNQFARITKDLEENQTYLLSLLEQDPQGRKRLADIQQRLKESRTEHARVVIAREGLRQKMEQFQNDLRDIAKRNKSLQSRVTAMQALVESSKAERDKVAAARAQLTKRLAEVERQLDRELETKRALEAQIASLNAQVDALARDKTALTAERERLNAHIASLQEDLNRATNRYAALENQVAELNQSLAREIDRNAEMERQRAYLQRRVGGLEQRLVELRDAGKTVLDRLGQRTRLTIDVIERTVQMTGLDVNKLLAQSDPHLGRGGPFIPADDPAVEFEPGTQLEAAVTMLDQQIDRWTALQDVLRSLPLSAPLNQYRISSRYGARRDPVNGRKAKHLGLDLAARSGTPVYATAPGRVVYAGWRGRYGRVVEIDHGFGIRTRYGHLRKILVKRGQEVANREKIGLVGSSGRSTGPHVHYEIRYKGRAQNPSKFLQAGNYVFKG
ncbi:MAG: hypothetical protein D6826_02275 [Alphaproteobacteria bacterium]|nr:MAG: hypothetical protein D6826_02275 [Alphaproteobacteria bacterium]